MVKFLNLISHFDSESMYTVYFIVGGLFGSSKRPAKKYRILHFIVSQSIVFLFSVCTIWWLLTYENNTVPDIGITLCGFDGVIFLLSLTPFTIYYYRREFDSFLEYVISRNEENFLKSQDIDLAMDVLSHTNGNHEIVKMNSVKVFIAWFLSSFVVYFVYAIMNGLDVWLFCTSDRPYQTMSHHLYGFPFMQDIPSKHVYYIIYLLEFVISFLLFIISTCIVVFHVMMGTEMNNAIVKYCDYLKRVSSQISAHFERYDLENENNFTLRTETSDSMFLRSTEKHFTFFIKEHQLFLRVVGSLRSYQEVIYIILLTAVYAAMFAVTYSILLDNLEVTVQIKQIGLLVTVSFHLLAHSTVGTMYESMREAIMYEVYNIPWYYFPPKLRKMINVFQCQVEQTITVKAMKVFPVNVALIPRVLQSIYSYINVIRTAIQSERLNKG